MLNEETIKNILAEELFGYRVCESTEDTQILNYFYGRMLLEKLLYGEPVSVPELRKLLRKKIVNFEFVKLDGEIRPAKGTTMMKYVPPKDHPKGIRPSSPKVATFFDLDKDAWRSVSKRSKELVLKKDKETDKPIIVVKDKSKVKVKTVAKKRESTDPIEQGKFYKYTTNRGTNTHVEILREMPSGLFQVSSPMFKTTFAVDPSRLGDEFTPEPEDVDVTDEKPLYRPTGEPDVEVKDVDPQEKPEVEVKDVDPQEKPEAEVKDVVPYTSQPITEPIKPTPRPQPIVEPKDSPEQTVIIPKEVINPDAAKEEPTKAPPADITPLPPPDEEDEDEGPEELVKESLKNFVREKLF